LLLSAPSVAGFRAQSSSLPYDIIIPPGYYQYFPITTVSSTSAVSFAVSSNTSLSTAFMTSSQLVSFNNSESDLSDSVYLLNGTSAHDTIHEPLGTYYLVLFAYGNTANATYGLQSFPIDPYYATPLNPPQPTGVASFGLYNQSGNAVPYQVETSEVVGVASVGALDAYNASAAADSSNISGATIQLNSILVVNESGGQQQVYWTQNTPDFVTATSQVAYGDNLWNFSVSGDETNSTITSPDGGYVSPNTGSNGDYYSQEISNSTYAFPFVLALLMNETVVPGTGVVVGMGAQMLQNGSAPATPVVWFDSITIHDATAQDAYFLVSGNQTTPNGLYYDTELIFGGENNGEPTDFTQLTASLGIFYFNDATGVLDSFPSLYSFGGDTAEAADNLQVSYSGSGFSQVTTGTPDYQYLGTASGTLAYPLSLSNMTLPSSSLTQTSSASTQSATSTASSQTSVQSSSSATASTTALGLSYLLMLSLAAAVAAVTIGYGTRSRVRHVQAHSR